MKEKNQKSKPGRKASPTGHKDDYLRVRATSSEKLMIQYMARKYADGDMSRWVRLAAMNYKPENEAV